MMVTKRTADVLQSDSAGVRDVSSALVIDYDDAYFATGDLSTGAASTAYESHGGPTGWKRMKMDEGLGKWK